jgi:hypothetical protein
MMSAYVNGRWLFGPAWIIRLYLAYDRLLLKLRWSRYRRNRA